MENWIKLHRQILDSEVFASQKMLKIWVWCLCKANYKTNFVPIKKGKGEMTVKIKRGEFLFGRFKAEEELFIDGSTIYKIMKKLEQLGNILIKSSNHYSIVTICNYNQYQNIKEVEVTAKEQLIDSKVTAKSQLSNTTKNEENDKTVKNDKKISDFDLLFTEFIKMRIKIKKPLTEKAKELILNRLNKLADNENEKTLILEKSIENSWQGIFPLKDKINRSGAEEYKKELELKIERKKHEN